MPWRAVADQCSFGVGVNRHSHALEFPHVAAPQSRVAAAVHIRPLHVGLAIAAALLLVYYVVQANVIAADTWRLRDAQDQLRTLSSARDGLIADEAKLDDRTVLQALAQAQGMVPAGAVTYLIQPADVAAAR